MISSTVNFNDREADQDSLPVTRYSLQRCSATPLTISIIIPAYNAEATLAATLHSCLNQTTLCYEIIVVDDGSSDNTAEIAASFEGYVQYIHVENGGVSRARNIGAERATGEWLLFLDADDLLFPHALEVLLATIFVRNSTSVANCCVAPMLELSSTSCTLKFCASEAPDTSSTEATLERSLIKDNIGVVYGMVIERREPPHLARLNGFDYAAGAPPHGAVRNFWRNAIITPGSALVKASLHQAIGGFVTGYEPMEDRDYWIKCGLLEEIVFCDTVVLDKIWRPASHGSQHSKRIYRGQQAQRALRAWASEHALSTEWMPDDKTILRSALDEAVWRRRYDILKPLLQEAKELGLFHWKGKLLSFLFC